MENSIFLKVFIEENGSSKLNIESLIVFSIYKYCTPQNINLKFVTSKNFDSEEIVFHVNDLGSYCMKETEIPWQVASCDFPVVKFDDTIVTGLCAVVRHICKFRSSPSANKEHEEGLLGFRKSCLQAPKEVSVWTNFCEVEIINSTKEICRQNCDKTFPVSLVRFENHLKKPVKVHNVYKIAQNIETKSKTLTTMELGSIKLSETDEILQQKERTPKNRKWKSKSKQPLVDTSTKIEDLNLSHEFAEGPFLTLADLILYPCYVIIKHYYGLKTLEKYFPYTSKWLASIEFVQQILVVQELLHMSIDVDIKLDFEDMTTPVVADNSLYKSDPKRHNPKKRLFTKENDIEDALAYLLAEMELQLNENLLQLPIIKWDQIPDGANPSAGHLPDKRMLRKSQQLENLASSVVSIAKTGDLIVDFCSGSGHLGILIAHLLPECTIILLENKEQSLLRARTRVHEMDLRNVYFFQCNLDFFVGKFDIGVALHACGVASDLVLDKCVKANAKFVLCPCCYGSLHETGTINYPRSKVFSSVSVEHYICIGHAADQTHTNHPLAVRGARCMAIIDSDRARLAEEYGYKVTLSRLNPLSCTPKNNLLIGVSQ